MKKEPNREKKTTREIDYDVGYLRAITKIPSKGKKTNWKNKPTRKIGS